MGLEVTSFISGLDESWPTGLDPINKGDDHLKLIKKVLKNVFPGVGGDGFAIQIIAEETEINFLSGVTSDIQAQIDANTAQIATNIADIAANTASVFPDNTAMLFVQTAAPTGWTKGLVYDDHALRLTTGTVLAGGTVPFETAFDNGFTGAHQLIEAEIPAHTHSLDHTFTAAAGDDEGIGGKSYPGAGVTGSYGGGGTHSHTLTLDVQYVDCIVATKDPV